MMHDMIHGIMSASAVVFTTPSNGASLRLRLLSFTAATTFLSHSSCVNVLITLPPLALENGGGLHGFGLSCFKAATCHHGCDEGMGTLAAWLAVDDG